MTEGEYLVARMKTKDTGPYDPGHAHLISTREKSSTS